MYNICTKGGFDKGLIKEVLIEDKVSQFDPSFIALHGFCYFSCLPLSFNVNWKLRIKTIPVCLLIIKESGGKDWGLRLSWVVLLRLPNFFRIKMRYFFRLSFYKCILFTCLLFIYKTYLLILHQQNVHTSVLIRMKILFKWY